jgi:hypothetical protein
MPSSRRRARVEADHSHDARFVPEIVRSADGRTRPPACKLDEMISTNGNGRCAPVVSAARVAAAERFAGVIVSTFEKCEETSVPLSKAQKTTMIEAALVEFDGFEAELSSLMRIAELLSELGRNGYSHVEQEID